MKNKLFLSVFLIAALNLLILNSASAQATGADYSTGLGIRLDLGNWGTYVGPAVKHFFSANSAGEASVLFGNSTTVIGAEYSYNSPISGASGLKWNIGIGPQFALYDGGSDVLLRPFAGLEFKIPEAPIDLGFDWRPAITLTHGSDFEAGRFGLAFRFTL
jgi:hypothetical protein